MRLLVVFLLLLFISCNRNTVQLEYTNARDEVPQLGNLVFRFDREIAADSVLNKWDSTEYVRFKPAIPGRFRWQQTNELVFSPAQPLPPSTTFTAQLTSEIIEATNLNSIKTENEISFHTPALRLGDVAITWMPATNDNTSAFPRADLYFNYRVSPEEISDKISIEVDGKAVLFDLLTLSDDKRISVALKGVPVKDANSQGKISLQKGLLPKGGTKGTDGVLNAVYTIPSPFNLAINEINSEHDGLTGTISVSTSQQLASADIGPMIRIEPAVKFSVEETDDGFQIKSDQFNADKSYAVIIKKGLRGNVGGVLQEEYNSDIAFAQLEPSITFTSRKGLYLSSGGNRQVEVRIVNVPKVKVVISKIYESNLLAARSYGYEPRESASNNEYYSGEYYQYGMSMGDVIVEKEIETSSLPKSGSSRLFTFNPEDNLSAFKGIYHIRVRSTENYWVSDSRFISLSDIGLVAKEGKDKLYVFANSIRTAATQAGINIVAYGNNNQVLAIGATNKDGVAELPYTRKEFAGFKPAMIVAKTENDFNYMPLAASQVNTSRFEVGGKKISNTSLDAFIYAERDIYRPGERINFSVIVRDPAWNIPAQLPLRFRMVYPNGKEFRVFRKSLNDQGSTEAQVDIPLSAITGTYVLEVYSSNDILIGNTNFNIEEFVPDRIRVTAKMNKTDMAPGEKIQLDLNAVNFFGPPAAGRNYELEIQLKAKDFSTKKLSGYNFAIRNKGLSLDKVLREGKLDMQGNAVEQYDVPAMFKNNGVLQADFYVTVFDETGRPVSRMATANVYTQQVFLGIKQDDYWYYALNQPVRFPVVAVDRSGNVQLGVKAEVEVVRHEYRTVLTKSGGYFRYESQESDKVVSKQDITISGENSYFQFVPRVPGNYELRVSLPGASNYVSRSFYSYGAWGGDAGSFEVNTDGNIDIETDKSVYAPGDNMKILFKTPFNGRLLITIEQDQVITYRYVDVVNRNASINFQITAEHLPNAFITATLFKAHGVSDLPLTVAHGFQNFRVEEKSRINKVAIIAAEKTRSGISREITVSAQPGSYVTLAAVDNGVLQVTDFSSPDPYKYFYANRALQVVSYDLYPQLFPELRSRLSSTGGDGELAMQKRVNPMPSKRIQILSYWSGIKKINGSGQAKFTLAIPSFSGQVRLMAVAYKDGNFGSAEAKMTVADPLVLSTALPRFLSPHDTIDIPVTISNTQSVKSQVTASVISRGPIDVIGSKSQKVIVPAGGESRLTFRASAGSAMDTANITVEVNDGREKFVQRTAIGIRPTASLRKVYVAGTITGGQSLKPILPEHDFIPTSASYSIFLSKSPVAELGEQLRYLVRYPYGCTEQIISSAFPQLYFGDLAMMFAGKKTEADNANRNVLEAIRTIKLRQLYNGALTLWEGEGTESWWTTAYAAHFLIEAKRAGFDVDESLLNTMTGYLNARMRKKQTVNYYYNRDQQKKIAPKEVAYSLYVLALAGRTNISAMNYYKANASMLSLDSKYLLGAAYAAAGDRRKSAELLPGSFTGEVSVPQSGGSFYSPIRDEAIALNALIDIDPSNNQIPVMANHVAGQLKKRSWFSTQECAFSLLALGKLARKTAGANLGGELRINGKSVAKLTDKDIRYNVSGKLSDVQLTASGSGALYFYVEGEGISASENNREEDSYIRVRRRFFDRTGKVLSANIFERNQLVIVQVAIEKAFDTEVENIVITDMLPAGFEIENPRTKELPGMDWISDASVPSQMDVRDDRMNLFIDLSSRRQVYYYAVRAVSTGVFKLGPVSADAMYNGEYHSYHGAGTIKINE